GCAVRGRLYTVAVPAADRLGGALDGLVDVLSVARLVSCNFCKLTMPHQGSGGLDSALPGSENHNALVTQTLNRLDGRRDPANDEWFLDAIPNLGEDLDKQVNMSSHQLQPDDSDMYIQIRQQSDDRLAQ